MKRILISSLLVLLWAVALAAEPLLSTARFVDSQLKTYPAMRLLDIYKTCFQDYMGAEHLVADTASARAYLMQELAIIHPAELQLWLYEPCGPQGRHVRVSLRVVSDGLVDAERLLDAFVRSAGKAQRPTVDEWKAEWARLLADMLPMVEHLPYFDSDRQFIDGVLQQGRYAISHSPDYRQAYHPHYRIVERSIFEAELLPLLSTP